ncbi:MAG: DUF1540 domain-containing protein [Oscillospiraceae bacterium]
MTDYNGNCKENNAIKGVSCDVSECKHHNGVRNCTAECISVECKETQNGKCTCCGTYQKR